MRPLKLSLIFSYHWKIFIKGVKGRNLGWRGKERRKVMKVRKDGGRRDREMTGNLRGERCREKGMEERGRDTVSFLLL